MRLSRALLLALPLWSLGCGDGVEEPLELPRPLIVESPFEYPVSLWDEGVEGETRLMVHVTATGEVDSVFVGGSSGHPEFDSAAVAGASRLRFSPGRRGDKRVDHWVVLPVRFSKDSASASGATEQMR